LGGGSVGLVLDSLRDAVESAGNKSRFMDDLGVVHTFLDNPKSHI